MPEGADTPVCHTLLQKNAAPKGNDAEWLTRTLAYWKEGDSLPTLKYEDASPWFELPPGERGYGGGKIIPAEIPADKIKTKEQAEEAIK